MMQNDTLCDDIEMNPKILDSITRKAGTHYHLQTLDDTVVPLKICNLIPKILIRLL